jgi:hypothetical protein
MQTECPQPGRPLNDLAASALFHRLVIFAFAISATAGLLTTVMNCVHRGPGTTFGFILWNTTLFISFLDMAGLAFLFVCVLVFVSSWHFLSSFINRDLLPLRSVTTFSRPDLAILMPTPLGLARALLNGQAANRFAANNGSAAADSYAMPRGDG